MLYTNFKDISLYLLVRTCLKIFKELLIKDVKPYKVFLNIVDIFDSIYKLNPEELKRKYPDSFPFLVKLAKDGLSNLLNISNC